MDKVKELMEQLEGNLEELFESEKYTRWLTTLSKFHRYSFYNTILIASQRPDASYVAGFQAWKKKFNRHVKKGEKAIKILAPIIRQTDEVKKDELGRPVLDKDGQPILEERLIGYRIVSVFDISQTEGEELPALSSQDFLDCGVEGYQKLFSALKQASPVTVRFEEVNDGSHGYFSRSNQEIVLKQGMSQADTLATLFHEMAHASLHNNEEAKEVDRHIKEVEAESVAYILSTHFGLPCEEVSLAYIAGWASADKDKMGVLKNSMSRIRGAASRLLTEIEKELKKSKSSQMIA